MIAKKWIKKFLFISILAILSTGLINYVVDPYRIFNTDIVKKPKIKQSKKIRQTKAIRTKDKKPSSIVLGTSRTEMAYDPNHQYFTKPSYNLATPGSSMYESKLNFINALKQGNLKRVLLVADFVMFNSKKQKWISDYETYFEDVDMKKFLFSREVLVDSIMTIKGGEHATIYYENGQTVHNYNLVGILREGGHLKKMKEYENGFYSGYPTNYTYKDTKEKTFPDFEEIVKLCYENDIELDIIFGPNHIRAWESLNYHLGYDKWLNYKKDIVLSVNKIAQQFNKKQFRIMDFAIYHRFTAEKIPTDKSVTMDYHWEHSHYKNALGHLVLDRLEGNSKYIDFGVELNIDNIENHLKQLEIDRHKFIDVEKYQIEVFGELKKQ
jgi:hypothetical protein